MSGQANTPPIWLLWSRLPDLRPLHTKLVGEAMRHEEIAVSNNLLGANSQRRALTPLPRCLNGCPAPPLRCRCSKDNASSTHATMNVNNDKKGGRREGPDPMHGSNKCNFRRWPCSGRPAASWQHDASTASHDATTLWPTLGGPCRQQHARRPSYRPRCCARLHPTAPRSSTCRTYGGPQL